jgi:hypothetical protein
MKARSNFLLTTQLFRSPEVFTVEDRGRDARLTFASTTGCSDRPVARGVPRLGRVTADASEPGARLSQPLRG